MKRFFVTAALAQLVAILSYSQSVKLDTIYYDKDWKGVSNAAFASFYRIYDANDKSELKKHFHDYYITGELQSEGGYISIDKYDDSKSVFDGEWTNYFKSGKVEQKGYRSRGIEEGEYTAYYENGLVKMHAMMKNGKANGILTQFNEEGDMCSQIEMLNGEPRYDYYILSNKDGYSSKLRISDNTPIYESPSLNEKKVDYRDGAAWPYYTKNGIMVAMTNTQVKDYGKWFQISLIIANNSIAPIEFDPDLITSSLQKTNGYTIALEVWSSDRYMRKVRRTQNWNMALAGIGEGLAAASAGYSTSTTQTNSTYNGYSNSYGNAYAYGSGGYAYGSYNGYGSYHGNSSTTSRTTTYDGAAAYQAQVIASNRMANYENSLLNERAIKQEGYLRKTTIYPGDAISGYVNIKRTSGSSMTVIVDINGAKYEFPWNILK
ncbi:MAG: membrane-binding protein [Bacteroidaceae bacterium]|nr:membrane-binding protein [Bacteroidaceae bacterium]